MPDGNPDTLAEQVISAGVPLAIAVAVVWAIRVVFRRRARRLASAVMKGELSPEVDTRLRLIERLIEAIVLLVGIAIALSQFEEVRTVGRALLTSGAIAAAIVGFAARQTLANVVAGIMIAITQPLRLGDHVAFEDHYGVVEDVTLSFTTLRTGANRRIVIPNEKLAAGVLRNDSLVSAPIRLEVDVWLPLAADARRATEVLARETDGDVSVAEVTPEGVRVVVSGEEVAPPDRASREAALRLRCLECLRADGLLAQS